MAKNNNEKKARRLFYINKNFDSAQEKIIKAKDGLCVNNAETFENNVKEAYYDAEQGLIKLRRFVCENLTSKEEKKSFFANEASDADIAISLLDSGVVRITMPVILPFHQLRKVQLYHEGMQKEIILDAVVKADAMLLALNNALQSFCENNPNLFVNQYGFTLCFVNVFDETHAEKIQIPDTDNYSYKAITDLIASYLMHSDDSYSNVDFFLRSERGRFTHTEIYVVPKQFWFDCNSASFRFSSSNQPKIIKFPSNEKEANLIA